MSTVKCCDILTTTGEDRVYRCDLTGVVSVPLHGWILPIVVLFVLIHHGVGPFYRFSNVLSFLQEAIACRKTHVFEQLRLLFDFRDFLFHVRFIRLMKQDQELVAAYPVDLVADESALQDH